MRIAISGKSGCGNTTICHILSEKLGFPMINFTFRQLAEERGVEFWEFCAMAEKDDNIDRTIDTRQAQLAMAEENCILGSRLAIWMLPVADLKVYLKASEEVRAKRILKREGGSVDEQMAKTGRRDRKDSARYKRIYGIDNNDTSPADLVINTDNLTPEEVATVILAYVKALD